jgi:hypothetical protein
MVVARHKECSWLALKVNQFYLLQKLEAMKRARPKIVVVD